DPDTVYDPDSWVQTLVPAGSTWRYRKGTSAPSQPLSAWRQLAFNDAGWSQGQAPIGYGETFIATTLSDMRNNYTSFFMRHKFQVDDPSAFYRLRLDVRYDDGANVWINGRLV